MATIAYVGIWAHGHTNPALPVLRELIEIGHRVMVYNAEEFREKIAPTGVEFRPYPKPLPTSREIAQRMTEMIQASLFFAEVSIPLTAFMVEAFKHERPDFIIYDTTTMWGYIAARIHQIPAICLVTHFVLDGLQNYLCYGTLLRHVRSAIPHIPKLIGWKRTLNRAYGKAHVGGITEYADLNLVFTSAEFHAPNAYIDDRFHFVGASIEPAMRTSDFPLDALTHDCIVYISLGTINNLKQAFYRSAFAAFANYPAQFVLSVGQHTKINSLGSIPANFIVRNSVPQLDILQRATVFITHGGMNSVHEGLYYGVPEIVIPQQMEQYVNGKRIAETQCGLLLWERYPYGQVTVEALRTALDTILANPEYKRNAQYYGQTLKNAGGYRQAVQEIEAFIEDKQGMPIPE